MNIIIVDDNERFRETLKLFLESEYDYKVISSVSSGEEFLKLNKILILNADVVLMDLNMEDLDGFETTKIITRDFNKIKIIAVTMQSNNIFIRKILEYGFKGFVHKSNVYDVINKSIDMVCKGRFFIDGDLPIDYN